MNSGKNYWELYLILSSDELNTFTDTINKKILLLNVLYRSVLLYFKYRLRFQQAALCLAPSGVTAVGFMTCGRQREGDSSSKGREEEQSHVHKLNFAASLERLG